MLKRIITGAGIVAVAVAFFFLRRLSCAYFEILIWLLAVVGSFEVATAMGERLAPAQKWVAVCFSALFGPAFYIFDAMGAFVVAVFAVSAQLALGVFMNEKVSLEGMGCAVLATLYPALLLVTVSANNLRGEYSTVALVLTFAISPLSDTFAYFVGVAIGGRKLCPSISPHKTVAGAIGGVLGGILGSLAVYFVFGAWLNYPSPAWWFYVIAGLVGAVLTEFGDLVESIVKRKLGIKDMGKILPGHGGIMDRIDGMVFASPFIFLCFEVLALV